MYVVPSLTSSYGIWKNINVLCTMFHNPSWVWVTKKVHWGEVVSSTRSFQLLLWETLQARLLVQGRKYRVGSSTIQQYNTYIVRFFYTRLILRVPVPIFFFDSDSTNIEHQKPHQQKSKQTSLSWHFHCQRSCAWHQHHFSRSVMQTACCSMYTCW